MKHQASFALDLTVDTHAGNLGARLSTLPAEGIVERLHALQVPVHALLDRLAVIDDDDLLSDAGKRQARAAEGRARLADVRSAKAATLIEYRNAIERDEKALAAANKGPRADVDAVRALLDRLAPFTPAEVGRLYDTATSSEQLVLEAIAEQLPRVPMRGPNAVTWRSLLPESKVEEAQRRRQALADPALAARASDLRLAAEIIETVGSLAERVVLDTLMKYGIDLREASPVRDAMTGAEIPQPAPSAAK